MDAIYPALKIVWIVWFMALFVFIVARAYWPSCRREMEARGRIPLAED